jgi:hypothetical protein
MNRRFNMSIKLSRQGGALLLLLACAMSAGADDKSEYNHRAAVRDLNLFRSLDRNGDGLVTQLEARGDVNFLPRFDDMETNMDGVVSTAEFHRYLDQQYGAQIIRGRP